jgi:hypothetical protein
MLMDFTGVMLGLGLSEPRQIRGKVLAGRALTCFSRSRNRSVRSAPPGAMDGRYPSA